MPACSRALVYDSLDEVLPTSPRSTVYENSQAIVNALVVPASSITFDKLIGTGTFGDVKQGKLARQGREPVVVAVKSIRPMAEMTDEALHREFVNEISTMAQLNHEHIVRVLALVVAAPPLVVLEYIPGGSLYDWFRKVQTAPHIDTILTMALHTAKGLLYLADHGVVHRDVASRNVLIRLEEGGRFTCKLTDFGLSRIFDKLVYHSQSSAPIPVRWTPLEGLFYSTFSEKSDMWSFGVLMWELLTYCRVFPYTEFRDDTELVEEIEKGLRLLSPTGTPPKVYQLMCLCWDVDPEKRPTFSQMTSILQGLIKSAPEAKTSTPPQQRPLPALPDPSRYTLIGKNTQDQWAADHEGSIYDSREHVYGEATYASVKKPQKTRLQSGDFEALSEKLDADMALSAVAGKKPSIHHSDSPVGSLERPSLSTVSTSPRRSTITDFPSMDSRPSNQLQPPTMRRSMTDASDLTMPLHSPSSPLNHRVSPVPEHSIPQVGEGTAKRSSTVSRPSLRAFFGLAGSRMILT